MPPQVARSHLIHQQHGIAVVKALAWTGILGVLFEVAAPRLGVLTRLERAERNLVAQLEGARKRAISEDRCFQAKFDSAARTFQFASKRAVTPCGTTGFANDSAARSIDEEAMIEVTATASPVFDTWDNAATTSRIKLTALGGSVRWVSVNAEGRVILASE
jgi:Tfp pilus assembly protein FimT